MKLSNLSKVVGAAVIACSLAVLPSNLPASAQQNNTSGSNGASSATGTAPDNTTNAPGTTGSNQMQATDSTSHESGFDWGWLGLIGLAGLAGLARKREEPTRYRDPGTVGTTGANYRE